MSFSAARLPSWAGEVHRQGKIKAKAKTRASKSVTDGGAGGGGGGGGEKGENRRPRKGTDPELEKIVVQKNALMTSRKWQQNAKELATDVAKTLGEASSVSDSKSFTDLILQRYEKFAAMAPKVELSPSKKVLDKDHDELREALTPISKGKTHQLEHPTKKGLEEYNRTMSSLESAVQKSLKTCSTHVEKVKLEEERENARKKRAEEIKKKEESRKAKALKKAKADGAQLADKDISHAEGAAEKEQDQDQEQDDEESEDEGGWPLAGWAHELLGRCQSPCVRLGLSCFNSVFMSEKFLLSFCVRWIWMVCLGHLDGQSVLAPTKFSVNLECLKTLLIKAELYKPDVCLEYRKKHPQALSAFKGSGIQVSLFEDQSPQVQGWMNSVLGGSQLLQKKLTEKEWGDYNMNNHLAAKIYTSGVDWQCTSFSDFMFAQDNCCIGWRFSFHCWDSLQLLSCSCQQRGQKCCWLLQHVQQHAPIQPWVALWFLHLSETWGRCDNSTGVSYISVQPWSVGLRWNTS